MGFLRTLEDKLRSRKAVESEEGFTLIELVVVVAVIGILSAVAIPSFGAIQENVRGASGQTMAKNTYAALVTSMYDAESLASAESILASANSNSDNLAVTVNEDWSDERDLCVTATWTKNPESIQNYGPSC